MIITRPAYEPLRNYTYHHPIDIRALPPIPYFVKGRASGLHRYEKLEPVVVPSDTPIALASLLIDQIRCSRTGV